MKESDEYQSLPKKIRDQWHDEDDKSNLTSTVTIIEALAGSQDKGIRQFCKGNSFLVLGCGSPRSTYEEKASEKLFEAWAPRLLWGFGAARIIGVDIYSGDLNDTTYYTHIAADIVPYIKKNEHYFRLSHQIENHLMVLSLPVYFLNLRLQHSCYLLPIK